MEPAPAGWCKNEVFRRLRTTPPPRPVSDVGLGPTWRAGAKRHIRPSKLCSPWDENSCAAWQRRPRLQQRRVDVLDASRAGAACRLLLPKCFTLSEILRNARISAAYARECAWICQPAARPREPLQPCAPLACTRDSSAGLMSRNSATTTSAWRRPTTTTGCVMSSLSRRVALFAGSTRPLLQPPPSAARARRPCQGQPALPATHRSAAPLVRWPPTARSLRPRYAVQALFHSGEARIGAGVGDWRREYLVPACWALGDSQLVADQRLRPRTSLNAFGVGQSHTGRPLLPYAPTLAAVLSKPASPPFSPTRRSCASSPAPSLVEPRVFLYPRRSSSRHPPIRVHSGARRLSRLPMSP
ncbi:hypothetical protein B0J12DRAFT_128695 [Macrophomina phaseolina]|uniref:Uncharacterized protein n=1 Tax=Macrophomina phaseolina TaxID=35725 RepID=A0ABQ8GB34_9PEZI|nr:hypothetical protein B0J12DRAFT_128695 [Macrophomina phaseolina]